MSPDIVNPRGAGAVLGKAAKEAREHHGCKRPGAVVSESLKGGGKQLIKARQAAGRALQRQMLEHHPTICNPPKIMALNYPSLALVH